jgi:hypothetical protein
VNKLSDTEFDRVQLTYGNLQTGSWADMQSGDIFKKRIFNKSVKSNDIWIWKFDKMFPQTKGRAGSENERTRTEIAQGRQESGLP